MAIPRCSECGEPLVYPDGRQKPNGTKTCSNACRQKRVRRRQNAKREAGRKSKHAPEVLDLADAARGELKDAMHDVAKEELRPLVREAMTEDVLRSIDRLVKLTPKAIGKLEADLEADDETIRQRAYTLLLRYTMGNPSVAPAPAEQAPAAMNVVFNVPRPGDAADALPVVEVDELRDCTDCSKTKPASEFVGGSAKCRECFEGLHDKLRDRFS